MAVKGRYHSVGGVGTDPVVLATQDVASAVAMTFLRVHRADGSLRDRHRKATTMSIRRLNHAVLYVSNAPRSAKFYRDILGFRERTNLGDTAIFLQASGSDNDHDIGLFQVGDRPGIPGSVGLYHLAWQVDTLEDLVAMRSRLVDAGALTGESDHGVSKSLYGRDPDGIEFEIMWEVPREDWPSQVGTWRLDLDAALARWPGVVTG